MRILNQYKIFLFIIIFSFFISERASADNFGRIFTSAEERIELEKIRHAKLKPKPKKDEITEVKKILDPVEPQKEIVIRDAITLKGLVHRSDGKSTAWINESNTFEGDLDSQFIQVPDNKINPDQVTIIMPDDSTQVELRVGEAFTPEPIEREIVDTDNTEASR
jgi:hypothetical protein